LGGVSGGSAVEKGARRGRRLTDGRPTRLCRRSYCSAVRRCVLPRGNRADRQRPGELTSDRVDGPRRYRPFQAALRAEALERLAWEGLGEQVSGHGVRADPAEVEDTLSVEVARVLVRDVNVL
jgi:hypothetical protein